MDAMEAMRSRRTARRFTEREIPDGILGEILEAGFKAPSNDHLRKWEFVVVRDAGRKRELVERLNRERTTEDAERFVSGSGMVNDEQKKMYIDAIPLQYRMLVSSSALILPFYYQPKDILRPESLSDLNYFASIWCAIENMLIAAANFGIYGVTRIPSEAERRFVRDAVRAPGDYDFPCYLALGYRAETEGNFRQVEIVARERIHVDRW